MAGDTEMGGGMLGDGGGGALGGFFGDLAGYMASIQDRDKIRYLNDRGTGEVQEADPWIVAQQEKAAQQGPSAFNNLGMDGTGRADQLAALDQLKGMYQSGGLDPTARAQMAEAQMANAQQAQALNGAVNAQAAQRGMMNGGASLAAQRSNAQAAANTTAMTNMQAAAGSQQRGMQALGQYLGGASGMRQQDYGQASDRARATDAINQFNTANQQGVYARNADRTQQAQQQTFSNKIGQGQAVAGMGAGYQQMADGTMKFAHNTGKGIGSIVGMMAGG